MRKMTETAESARWERIRFETGIIAALDKKESTFFSHSDPVMVEWFIQMVEERRGSATAFMITGPSTKITNLGALKIVLGARRLALYLLFVILFALASGLMVNLIV